jgi:hypothetical protein
MSERPMCLDGSSMGGEAMKRIAVLAAGAVMFVASGAQAGYLFKGNDTGGIISWSPEIAHTYKEIAAIHCWQYNKVAFITSVHPVYGDYVGFVCAYPQGYDPVKARSYQAIGVVRARD